LSQQEYQVDNCPRCGKVYTINAYQLCLECRHREVSELQQCIDFMYKNNKADLEQLSQATGIDSATIIKFIQEGKIPMSDFVNLTYPCDLCQSPIRANKMCANCLNRMKNDIQKMMESTPITDQNVAHYQIRKRHT
jgi:hypothetical protein